MFARVGQTTSGIQPPSMIIYMYGGRCPRCGKPLRKPRLSDIHVYTDVEERVLRLIEEARRMRAPVTPLEMAYERLLRGGEIAGIRGPGEVEAEA